MKEEPDSAVPSYDQLLFLAASGLEDEGERRAFLNGACAQDAALKNKIEEMFAVQQSAAAYFEARPTADDGGGNHAGTDHDRLDTKIGRYRLIDRLGEGGCGVVYLAEQGEPVRRKVALKIIRLGMDTQQVIARFEAERQSLAMMDHPNIARVLDAGATTSGRPFFVMELVDGEKITEFCDANRLGVRQRLEVFIQVCQAIHHAHQKGVLHRDIKPSNIIVRMQDGVPVAKVIDFGIARAATRGSDDDPAITTAGQFVGTPAYMSPEVAAGSMDVDTRCDIHSLGVVLFELLTGRTPFGMDRFKDLGMDEIRRILSEEDPPAASSLLASLESKNLAEAATMRGFDGRKLIQRVKGDLDWIAMKAMDRDRNRRYESADGLAADVNRHLNHEAVSAGPPNPFYRLSKLIRRNKVPFLSGATAFLALTAGFGVSTVLFLREKDARAQQERLRTVAEIARGNEATLRQRAEYRERISNAAVQVSHRELEAADLLLKSVPFGQVPPSLEAAEAYTKVGEWHVLEGRWKEAMDYFSNLALVMPMVDPADSYDISVTILPAAALLSQSGDIERYHMIRKLAIERFSDTSRPIVAEQVFKATLLLPADPETLAALRPLAALLEEAIEAGHSEISNNNFRTSWCCFSLALMKYRAGEMDAASRWAERALSISGSHAPRNADLRSLLAMIEFRRGDTAKARALLDAARQPVEEVFSKPMKLGGVSSFWFDWIIARTLYDEAGSIIGE